MPFLVSASRVTGHGTAARGAEGLARARLAARRRSPRTGVSAPTSGIRVRKHPIELFSVTEPFLATASWVAARRCVAERRGEVVGVRLINGIRGEERSAALFLPTNAVSRRRRGRRARATVPARHRARARVRARRARPTPRPRPPARRARRARPPRPPARPLAPPARRARPLARSPRPPAGPPSRAHRGSANSAPTNGIRLSKRSYALFPPVDAVSRAVRSNRAPVTKNAGCARRHGDWSCRACRSGADPRRGATRASRRP